MFSQYIINNYIVKHIFLYKTTLIPILTLQFSVNLTVLYDMITGSVSFTTVHQLFSCLFKV